MSRKYSSSQFSRVPRRADKKSSYWKFKLVVFLILFISVLLFLCKDVEPERGRVITDVTEKVKAGEFK